MERLLFACTLTFISHFTTAQTQCDCTSELEYIIEFTEENLPGFRDNVNESNSAEYEAHKNKLLSDSRQITAEVECLKTLTYYVEYFKDQHTSILHFGPDVDWNDDASIRRFLQSDSYQATETYQISSNTLEQYPLEKIEGIYQNQDTTLIIAVVEDKTINRDYVGVVTKSATKKWKEGQVILEIKQSPKGTYSAFTYSDDRTMAYRGNYPFINGILGDTWYKAILKQYVNPVTDAPDDLTFKRFGDSIAYVRIPWFYPNKSKKISEFMDSVDHAIRNTKYLIVDVRNNGGGSNQNAMPLLDYIYTQPYKVDHVQIYATAGNVMKYENLYAVLAEDTINTSQGMLSFLRSEIDTMKKVPEGTFIDRTKEDQYITRDTVLDTPAKVAVLYNKYSASACESFIFWAKDSEKTTLVGENSGGYVGYGENLRLNTPCYNFTYLSTMTRYERNRKWDGIGIPPDHYLSHDQDWIEQTITILTGH